MTARRARHGFVAAAIASALVVFAGPGEASPPAWPSALKAELATIDAQSPAGVGVYVRDLDGGASVSHRAAARWYLASMVKVPVAIGVLRGVEAGRWSLDSTVTLRNAHYVDGAGSTNTSPAGTPLTVRFLLEQMIVHSDNTATDMLLELAGVSEVNAIVEALAPAGLQRITTLGETRRLIYGRVVANADQLSGPELMALRNEPSDARRLRLLARLTDTPVARLAPGSLDAAYDGYYASGLNSGRLDAYGELLARLAEGDALTPPYTEWLLNLMERVVTGPQRIKAGLPRHVRWAHKTGTQRRRVCDSGLLRWPEAGRERRVVVVACTREEASLARAELTLMQVGHALCRSGLMTQGTIDAPACTAEVPPLRGPAAPSSRR